ncbi:MAG: hypothetical protein QW228_03335 [Candidatus Aenigmatarchaeota archaeon]
MIGYVYETYGTTFEFAGYIEKQDDNGNLQKIYFALIPDSVASKKTLRKYRVVEISQKTYDELVEKRFAKMAGSK